MSVQLEESYEFCVGVARERARNFYYSFALLSRPQRRAMCAVYAFMRRCDDLSDDPGASRARLEEWRRELDRALAGGPGPDPIWPALCDAIRQYKIPHRYFHEIIDGVASDLEPRTFRTFDDLYRYCYLVASVVGMTVVHILGFDSLDALALAEKCGIAFQLTNILRDIREDAALGRTYLPAEDLDQFEVDAIDLARGLPTDHARRLLRFEVERARRYYRDSAPLLDMVHPSGRKMLWAIIEIYRRLLDKIDRAGLDALRRRVRLSAVEKCWIVLRAWR